MAKITPTAQEAQQIISRWESGCYTEAQRATVAEFKLAQAIGTPPKLSFVGFVVRSVKDAMRPRHSFGFGVWLNEIGELLDLITATAERADKVLSDYLDIPLPEFNRAPSDDVQQGESDPT